MDLNPLKRESSEKILYPSSKKLSIPSSFRFNIPNEFIYKILQSQHNSYLNRLLEFTIMMNFTIELIESNTQYFIIAKQNNDNGNILEKWEDIKEFCHSLFEEIKQKQEISLIDCSKEEFFSIQKKFIKKKIQIDDQTIRFINTELESIKERPILLSEFMVEETFRIEFCSIGDPSKLKLEQNEIIILTSDQDAVYLDDITFNVIENKKLSKFIKKLPVGLTIIEGYNNYYVQILEKNNENVLSQIKDIINNLLDILSIKGEYLTIYYPLIAGYEEEVISFILNYLNRNLLNNGINCLSFPSKITFIVSEKQHDLCLTIIETMTIKKISQIKNDWCLELDGEFLLPKSICDYLDLAYNAGEETGKILISNKYLSKIENKISNKFQNSRQMPFFNPNIRNFNIINLEESNKDEQDIIDTITISLNNFEESSKLFKKTKIISTVHDIYVYFDESTNDFVPYPTIIQETMHLYSFVGKKTFKYHQDLELFNILDQLIDVDFKNKIIYIPENKRMEKNNNQNSRFVSLFNNNHQQLTFNYEKHCIEVPFYKIGDTGKKKSINGEFNIARPEFTEIKKSENDSSKLEFISLIHQDPVLKEINKILMEKKIYHRIKVKKSPQYALKALEKQCKTENLQIKTHEKNLIIWGHRKTINRLRKEIQLICDNDENEFAFPETWKPQPNEGYLEVLLERTSEEFKKIELNARPFKVESITRIQNTKLWENYIFEKKKLRDKGDCTEKLLWHGTRSNNPSKIYSGVEEGFDLRYANQGMFGKGIYFSENVSYSATSFGFKNRFGNTLLLYANVLVGKYYDKIISKPSSLVTPPLLPGSNNTRYDSIIHGNNMCIIYNSNRAYPAYLVELKIN